ncbi:MAG TPA: hypothetical protein VFF79_08685 [Conexibacter sp.]|nr:hypothetical protein [Conexibacter sp.]
MPIVRTAGEGVLAVLPMQQSPGGVSASFLVQADDGADYWCKATNNPVSPRIPVNEQVVARLGQMIGICVPDPVLVKLDGIAGWEFRRGHVVEAGWAHGCAAVAGALETRVLGHRSDDDNRVRHAGFYGLMDWLAGGDPQWLYSAPAENAYFSHDHGHFFPGGPDWTPASLASTGTGEHGLGVPATGLDPDEVARLADAIEAVTKDEIDGVMSKIPLEWLVADDDLAALSDFLEARRAPVAARLRALLP